MRDKVHENLTDETIENIESDFAKFRKEEIRKRNGTNKRRSREQERDVAKFLGASRVPMSGAGMLKGDGIWNTSLGLVVYECKYSAARNIVLGPTIRLDHKWLEKLDRDVKSMNARFGFLVITYFAQIGGKPWSPVFINEHVAELLLEPEWIEGAYEYGTVRTPKRETPLGTQFYYLEYRNSLKLNRVFPCSYILTSRGKYVILPLWALKQRVDDLSSGGPSDISGTTPT